MDFISDTAECRHSYGVEQLISFQHEAGVDPKLTQEYVAIVEAQRAGEDLRTYAGAEHRINPRIQVHAPPGVTIDVDADCRLLELSMSGASFLCHRPLPRGTPVSISLNDTVTVHGTAVHCAALDVGPEDAGPAYRVGCRYFAIEQGMELLVRIFRSAYP